MRTIENRVKISGIDSSSQAALIGLAVGDIIESFNCVQIHNRNELVTAIQNAAKDGLKTADIVVFRDLKKLVLSCEPLPLGVDLALRKCMHADGLLGEPQQVESFCNPSLKSVIAGYIGWPILINAVDPSNCENFLLCAALDDHFVVHANDIIFHFPYTSITSVSEKRALAQDEFQNDGILTVRVNHLVLYDGPYLSATSPL